MKKLITITLLLIGCQLLKAQSPVKKNSTNYQIVRISYVSPKRDTLILPNDSLGKLIHSTWVDTPKSQQPVIIFASEEIICKKNGVYKKDTKKVASR